MTDVEKMEQSIINMNYATTLEEKFGVSDTTQ